MNETQELPLMDLNQKQWLDTVPDHLMPFVERAIAAWNLAADAFNQWTELGWDERDCLLSEAAETPTWTP